MTGFHRMDRDHAASLGRSAVAIARAGEYRCGLSTVDIRAAVERAVAGTRSYAPEADLPVPDVGTNVTRVTVANETTLEAAARFAGSGRRVLALNFASATHPGGGFLSGARAQEESLCRSSALYACLSPTGMYRYQQDHRNPLYSDYAVYSPGVPVFRSDDGSLLPEPYTCSFLTCAAVNVRHVRDDAPHLIPEVTPAMRRRMVRVLSLAALHPHDVLVLGAWGCGAFENDPTEIAGLFHDTLSGDFRGVFPYVHFAVYDQWDDRRQITPFERRFA